MGGLWESLYRSVILAARTVPGGTVREVSGSPFDSSAWGAPTPPGTPQGAAPFAPPGAPAPRKGAPKARSTDPKAPKPPKPPLRRRILGLLNGKGSGPEPRTGARRAIALVLSSTIAAAMGLGAGLGTKEYIVQPFQVPSESMYPTLTEGDRIAVEKLGYLIGQPRRGQVVVFSGEGIYDFDDEVSFYVKRVIAVEGDTIACCDKQGRLVINGAAVSENYLGDSVKTSRFKKVVVPEGHIFVMGDNREDSLDSRFVGTIPIDQVVGHVFARIWPVKRIYTVPVQ